MFWKYWPPWGKCFLKKILLERYIHKKNPWGKCFYNNSPLGGNVLKIILGDMSLKFLFGGKVLNIIPPSGGNLSKNNATLAGNVWNNSPLGGNVLKKTREGNVLKITPFGGNVLKIFPVLGGDVLKILPPLGDMFLGEMSFKSSPPWRQCSGKIPPFGDILWKYFPPL